MIKLIIFDLDGVLTESKDLHYETLNKALSDYRYDKIKRQEHISIYDGLSTYQKLIERNIKISDQKLINDRKQKYTSEVLEKSIKKDEKFISIFAELKKAGYLICIASNSIRYTTQLIIFKLGLMKYVDCLISNEDVQYKKPHPEMYLQCMIKCNVGPRESLVIEDSYIGRQGAFNSGAYLCPVNEPKDVTYDLIISYIERYEGKKPKWKGDKMNILIPMAGAGSRFVKAGYTFPKPLIDINSKPMIQVVVENINIEGKYIYLVQKEHYEKYNLKYMLEMITPNCEVVQVDGVTEGAACTTLLAKELINNDEQLLIANSDQFIKWDSSNFMYSMQNNHVDGGVLTFYNTHPKWSYAKTDENGFITDIKEKMVISDKATVGIYHWKKGSDYVKYAEQMIKKDIRVNNEFYVAPVYNESILDGKKFKTYNVDEMYGLGTPEDLNLFLSKAIK